jgi:ribose transport system substrate-binding protein
MKKKKILALAVTLLMAATLFAGCATPATSTEAHASATETTATAVAEETETTTTTAAEGTLQSMVSPDEEYIIVNCYNNLEFFNAQKWGWQKAGELFGVKTSFVGPMNGDVNAMVSAFETAIAKNPAGICVWGYDPGLAPSIKKAMDAGINVVTYVGDVEGSDRLTYIGSSQYDIGYQGAKLYAESIGGSGNVAVMTLPGNPMFEERQRGFEEGFAAYPGIKIVAYGDTKADTVTAISAAKDIIAKNPDLKGFVCTDSTGAIGASTAVQEMGMLGKIDILGLDRNSDVLQMIKDGTITASIVQDDVSMSYWAMVSLITAKHFDMPLTSDNAAAGAKVAPINIFTSINIVTVDNADYYLAQNKIYTTIK